ncbi:hypothetical protein GRI48_13910 [Altererythrobacter oceanensis]|uniref:CinA C-terminal domain-containing protein n=1 Tax=Qipengyuania oceanensis TaxID=1463597 RepID=A0A844YMF2_9SPHN|nr:hypothetical protein [Qipengyuania oceanensis]
MAIAESCTGGMVASSLVDNPEVGGTLKRCLVVYSNQAKCDLLGLDRRSIEECDGVSEEVARTMIRSYRRGLPASSVWRSPK